MKPCAPAALRRLVLLVAMGISCDLFAQPIPRPAFQLTTLEGGSGLGDLRLGETRTLRVFFSDFNPNQNVTFSELRAGYGETSSGAIRFSNVQAGGLIPDLSGFQANPPSDSVSATYRALSDDALISSVGTFFTFDVTAIALREGHPTGIFEIFLGSAQVDGLTADGLRIQDTQQPGNRAVSFRLVVPEPATLALVLASTPLLVGRRASPRISATR